jgi:hypothetical protein
MKIPESMTDSLEKQLRINLGNRRYGKRATWEFFNASVNHIQHCKNQDCHVKNLLQIWCEKKRDSE